LGTASEEASLITRRIVTDTGPLLHLAEADALSLVPLAGAVSIPPAVATELSEHADSWFDPKPEWLTIETLDDAHAQVATEWQDAGILDAGEAEAIGLAQQLQADWFLTDDSAARFIAEQRGIEVHGSAGIIVWAAAVGYIDRAQATASMERLLASSLWLSEAMRARVEAALRAVFE
jgi:predicted nucleic acid-binding protein